MEGQMQEHSEKKQPFAGGGRRQKSSVRDQPSSSPQEGKSRDSQADATMDTLSPAMTERDQTRVAELAYVLYEQRGRGDGQDMEDWLEAERRILTQE